MHLLILCLYKTYFNGWYVQRTPTYLLYFFLHVGGLIWLDGCHLQNVVFCSLLFYTNTRLLSRKFAFTYINTFNVRITKKQKTFLTLTLQKCDANLKKLLLMFLYFFLDRKYTWKKSTITSEHDIFGLSKQGHSFFNPDRTLIFF